MLSSYAVTVGDRQRKLETKKGKWAKTDSERHRQRRGETDTFTGTDGRRRLRKSQRQTKTETLRYIVETDSVPANRAIEASICNHIRTTSSSCA